MGLVICFIVTIVASVLGLLYDTRHTIASLIIWLFWFGIPQYCWERLITWFRAELRR